MNTLFLTWIENCANIIYRGWQKLAEVGKSWRRLAEVGSRGWQRSAKVGSRGWQQRLAKVGKGWQRLAIEVGKGWQGWQISVRQCDATVSAKSTLPLVASKGKCVTHLLGELH